MIAGSREGNAWRPTGLDRRLDLAREAASSRTRKAITAFTTATSRIGFGTWPAGADTRGTDPHGSGTVGRTAPARNHKVPSQIGLIAKPAVVLVLSLAGCGGGGGSGMPASSSQTPVVLASPAAAPIATITSTPTPAPTPAATPTAPTGWEIGPIIDGVNRSVGMASGLQASAFDFPQPNQATGHVHYVTFRHGSLSGKSRITLRYRIDAAPGVQILPKDYPQLTSTLTLYFQRRSDNWSAQGSYQYYRWYASAHTVRPLVAGENTITVSLDDVWTPVLSGTSLDAPDAFAGAKSDADRVGFVFGGGDGLGHGVYATGPAKFTILAFEVQ